MTTCPIHKIKLIDRCQGCGDNLQWNRGLLNTCKCGFNFIDSKTEKTSPRATNIIYELLDTKDSSRIHQLFYIYDTLEIFFNFIEIPISDYNLVRASVFGIRKTVYLETRLTTLVKNINIANGMHPRIILHSFLISKSRDLVQIANRIFSNILVNMRPDYQPLTGYINARTARAILDIQTNTFDRLYKANIIEGYRRNGRTAKTQVISLNSLNSLIIKFSKKNSYSKFGYNLNYQMLDKLKSTIKINEEFNIDDLLSNLSEINQHNHTKKTHTNKHLTILEASNICDVHYENIRFAVHCGILKRLPSNATNGTRIFISESSVTEFNQKYIFTKNIASKFKINPHNIAEKIISKGVNPVSGPNIDGGLTYVFKRSDLEQLDFKEIAQLKNYPTKTGRKKIRNLPIEDHSLPATSVAKAFGISTQKVSQLIRKGFLTRHFDNKRNLSVTYESFKKIYDYKENSNYIHEDDVAYILNETKKEMYKRYVDTRIIHKVSNGIDFYFTAADFKKVKKFKKTHITSKEAGKALGASGSYVNNLNKMKKIYPIKVFPVGRNNIFFYDRKSLIRYCKTQGFDTENLKFIISKKK